MQRDELISLAAVPTVVSDPLSLVVEKAAGKRVLNVGASGGVENYLPDNRDIWLHYRIGKVAKELVGIDIDAESVAYAANHGVSLLLADCETCHFEQPFDLIVMSDVIEHLNAPVTAIANLSSQLSPGGVLMITTPNPTHYSLVIRAWLSRPTAVYYDHVSCFLPEHFQAICNRLNLNLKQIIFFTHMDSRSRVNRLKSLLARMIGSLMPRCNGTFMVVLQTEKNS